MTPGLARARGAILAGLLTTTAAPIGCGSPAQTGIVAEITTDLRVPGELDEVRVSITDAAGSTLYQQAFALAAGAGTQAYALPLRVGVQPQGSTASRFRIEAIGRLAAANVVSRSATLTFVSGRVLLLPLPLLATCRQVTCTQAGETCRDDGTCAPDAVDPTRLPPYSPGSDAGPPPDARDGEAGGRGGAAGGPGGTTGDAGGAGGAGGRGGGGGVDAGGGSDASDGGGDGPIMVPTLNNGLVGYWAFDQAARTFPDYSGNGNTLTAPSATTWTASGHVGGALDLVNTADFGASTAGSASVNTITSAISIAGWIVPQGGTLRTIVSRVINTGFWKLSLAETGAVRFSAGPMVAQAPNAAGDGSRWVHVAATYDGAGVRLYVGGALVAQAVFGAVSLVGGAPDGGAGGYGIDVGGVFDNINAIIVENYRGQLDELTIYNRALTPGEVEALARGALPMRR
jgi:hypothetical protein